MSKQKLVVIGNGMAGARAVEEVLALRRRQPVRHRHVRRRALRQLQPHPAVEHSERRAGHERDLHQSAGLVRGQRHQAARRNAGRRHRPLCQGRRRGQRCPSALRQAADRHRQPRLHSADGRRQRHPGQDQAGRLRLSHHRRLHQNRRDRPAEPARGGHRRRTAGPGSGARAAQPRLRGSRRSPRRAPDGDAGRSAGRRDPQGQHGGDGRQRPSQEADHRDPRAPTPSPDCSSRTARRSTATWWWSPPASSRTPRSACAAG